VSCALLVVGGGRMGSALLGGLLRAGFAPPDALAVLERRADTRRELAERFPGVRVVDVAVPADGVILAVKPVDLEDACAALRGERYPRALSVVAGASTASLEALLPAATAVVRAMPNMPALLGAGASALCAGSRAGEEDLAWAEAVLSSVGVVARLPEERLDAVTGLSGSGPAYLFLLAEALVDAGVHEGLEREVSRLLVVHTLLGSARLLVETGESAEALRAAVTSPGGTTAAGLAALEARAWRAAVLEAVGAAAQRARVLGGDGPS
jgi:pyrroline-5-carboxylate reductase